MNQQANVSLEQAADVIRGADSVLVTTHAKPDGDAFGCVVALTAALRMMGKNATAYLTPPVPQSFQSIKGFDLVRVLAPGELPSVENPDLIVVADTGAWAQVQPLRPYLESRADRTLILDHHLTGDMPARWRFVDPRSAACCEIVARLLDCFHKAELFNSTVCEALFVGLASDTGWFRFSNTTAQTHELAARLLNLGVDQADLYRRLEQNERPEKLALLARALGNLRLLAAGKAAVMVLRPDDFARSGARLDETEQFIDLPRMVGSVEVVALVVEPPLDAPLMANSPGKPSPPPAIRVSFRSKSGPAAVDVAQLAQRFGGGGHARAAGAKMAAPFSQVVAQVTTALEGLFS